MANFLINQLDYIYFCYGLSFVVLSIVAFLLVNIPDKDSGRTYPWLWLAIFGMVHGVNEWFDLVANSLGSPLYFSIIRVILLVISFLALLEFGRRGQKSKLSILIYIPLSLLALSGLMGGLNGLNITVRYFLGFPAGLLSTFVFFQYNATSNQIKGRIMSFCGWLMLLYSIAAGIFVSAGNFFPASILNSNIFFDVFGLPIQLIRGLLALLLVIFLWNYYDRVKDPENKNLSILSDYLTRNTIVLLIMLFLIGGFILTNLLGAYGSNVFFPERNSANINQAKQLDDLISKGDQAALSLSGSPSTLPALLHPTSVNLANMEKTLIRYKNCFDFSVCYLIDRKGRVISTSNRLASDSFLYKDFSGRLYFQKAMKGQLGQTFFYGIVSKKRGYYSSYPIYINRQKNPLGVVVIKQDINDEILSSHARAYLIDKNGLIFASNQPQDILHWLWPVDSSIKDEYLSSGLYGNQLMASLLTERPNTNASFELKGHKYYYFAKPLLVPDWSVVQISEASLLLQYRLFGIFIVLIFNLGFLIFFFLLQLRVRFANTIFREKQQFSTVIESIGDGLITTDLLGKVALINLAAQHLTGWDDKSAIGHHVDNIFHIIKEDTRLPQTNPVNVVLATGKDALLANHTLLISKDGQERVIADSAAPILDESGKMTGAVLVFRDVTEAAKLENQLSQDIARRKSVEAQLKAQVENLANLQRAMLNINEDLMRAQEKQSRLSAIVESTEDAIYAKDLNMMITAWNLGAEKLYGYSASEMVGRPMSIIVPSDKLSELDDITTRILKGEHAEHLETLRLCKNKQLVPVSLTVSPIFDVAKKVIGFSAIARDISDRKMIERERAVVAAELIDLYDNAPCGYHSLNKDGVFIKINNTELSWFGYSREEVVGKKTLSELMTPESREGFKKYFPILKSTGFLRDIEFDVVRKDGTILPLVVNATAIKDENGNYLSNRATLFDNTERKKIQNELLENEKKFSSIFQLNPAAISLTDLSDGKLVEFNERFVQTTGYSPDEIHGHTANDLKLYPDPQAREYIIKNLNEHGQSLNYETIWRRKSGEILNIIINAVTINIADKRYALGIVVDISERKKDEEAIRNLSEAVRQAPSSIVITNIDGNIEFVNPFFTNISGYSVDEVLGKNPRVLKSGETTLETYQKLWATILSGQTWHGEFHNKKKDGSLYWESASISPIKDDKGVVRHFVGIKEDITEAKKLQEELSQKNVELQKLYNIKSEFTSSVSHELRTPLTAIKDGIGIVLDGSVGPLNDDQKEFLDIAKRNVDRLHRLINDVLDFSKLESGKMNLNFTDGNLLDSVEDAFHSQKIVAEQKGLKLETDIEADLPIIKYDHDKIEQVLINFINNALKFTKTGKIIVIVRKDPWNKGIKIGVKDTGPGIAQNEIATLFQKFQQLGGVNERKTGGTGLGLAISKEIVARHNGKVWVESVVGQGSTFWFTIPLV